MEFKVKFRTTPLMWAINIGVFIGGIAQLPRIDFQIGPFWMQIFIGKE